MNRVARLAECLKEEGVDAYFAQTPTSLGYLQGFQEDAHERFMALGINSKGDVVLISPALSATQAKRAGVTDVRTWTDSESPLALFEKLAEEWNLRASVIAVDNQMPAKMLLDMQSTLPAALFKAGQSLLGQLIRRKDAQELALMRQSAKIADSVWTELQGFIRPGLTESDVDDWIRQQFRDRGAEPTFCIVASGPGGAEPHHLSDSTVLKSGDVVVTDFGASYKGYQSDITRMVALGHASQKAQDVYKIVYDAHMTGRQAVKAGVSGAEVDASARKVIDDAGFGPYFFHRLGHGIGMSIHEEPYVAASNSAPLEPGNCFSIEPGIYLAGEFGIRIENIVTCTEDGHESFNAEPSATLTVV